MKEKFSDFESVSFLATEGEFEFTINSYELTAPATEGGFPVAKFEVQCDEGKTTIRHSLNPKARWSYNNLIAAVLNMTKEQRREFVLDYETIGNDLVGKKFIGRVECEQYEKAVKKPLDDGTFEDTVEIKEGYKIVEYQPC